jgi:hypothetical protein
LLTCTAAAVLSDVSNRSANSVAVIVRSANPSNRREVRLAVTPSGRRLVGRVLDRRREEMRRVLDDLEPAERAATVRGFEIFAAHAAPVVESLVVHEWPLS